MKTFGLAYFLCGTLSLAGAFVPHHKPQQRPGLLLTPESPDPEDAAPLGKRQRIRQWLKHNGRKYLNPALVGGLTFVGSAGEHLDGGRFSLPTLRPPAAHASAPVMALPKAEGRDPASEALMEHERRMVQKAQAELRERDRQAREIERTQGEAARVRFEKEYQARKEEEAAERAKNIENRKRSLLDEGIDPFTDLEGRRQITLLEKGVDLGEVSGTPFNMEKEYERKSPQKSMKVKKQAHRKMVACIVQDMKNRGVDPLEYFETHQERTLSILDLPVATAQKLAQEYEANLEKYGQITIPKEGELSVKEKMAQAAADPKAKKAAAKKAKEEEKARLKAEKEAAKAKAKQAKEEAKRLKQEEKEKVKALKESAKAAAAAAAVAGAAASSSIAGASGAAGSVASPPASPESIVGQEQVTMDNTDMDQEDSGISEEDGGDAFVQDAVPSSVSSESKGNKLSSFKVLPAGGAVLLVAGGGYTIKMFREKSAAEEEERQRQFRMLMGESSTATEASPAPALEEIDDAPSSTPVKSTAPAPVPAPPAPAPVKKRRLGIFKKKSERETDLSKLVAPDAAAPEFATLLAKILTYGAPGRFPSVEALPGEMPFDSFDIDLAKQMLMELRAKDDIPPEESAEVFANVVNCMLIDIVDLASSSLKEKESKKTVEALNIVVEFMNHAASLYDAVAGDTTIKPVVYEGTLSKSKLEQMFSTYAAAGMTDLDNLSEDFDSRVTLLQDVFQISEKKAEGLMVKAMQKQMMEMMKDPKGMEEMMKNMGGMEGMGDLMGGNGEDIDTEQLMSMMRELKASKDRGEISKEELDSVRNMFKEAFGSSIDTLDESTMSSEDKEVLAAMREILND